MKTPFISYVGWFLLGAALCFYGYGIIDAIVLSWSDITAQKDIAYSDVLATSIGSMQALLLANLGMVLGISVAQPGSAISHALKLNKTGIGKVPPPPMEVKEQLQLFALLIYVLALTACLVTWIVNGFSVKATDVVLVIPESGKMFIGVVLAYLTAVLSK